MKDACPVVVYHEGCVQGCHGCGNLCPVGAIEYIGDNTGWVPPGKKVAANESCYGDGKDKGCCGGPSCCG